MTVVDVELVEVRLPLKAVERVPVWFGPDDVDRPMAWVERADVDAGRVVVEMTGRTRTVKVDRCQA